MLAGLVTSAVLPLLVLTRTVWVEPVPQVPMQDISIEEYLLLEKYLHQEAETAINWAAIGLGIYLAGIIILLTEFILEIISLKKLLKNHNTVKENNFRIIDTDEAVAPFSFFNYIVYNSSTLKKEELNSIITHEKVHSRQKHSADMILGQLFCILFWFNPFIWLYKKAIAQNLEFIADSETAKQVDDITCYQKTLLKITVQPQCIAITNHFYQSLIKKRIVMLNKKQSSKLNSWKYAIVAPILVAFMVLFQVEVNAQVKKGESKVTSSKLKVALEVTKDSKDDELNAEKDFFKEEFDAELEFSDIKRNDKGEITAIKAVLKSPGESTVYQVSGTSPIKTFNVEIEQDDNGEKNMYIGLANNSASAHNNVLHGKAQGHGTNSIKGTVLPTPPTPPAPPSPPSPPAAPSASDRSSSEHWSIDNVQINNDDILVVINGQKQVKGGNIKIPVNQEVKNVVVLDKKDGKKKYGKDGKKGVVEITTNTTNSRYKVHTFSTANNAPMRIYMGENHIDYEEIQKEIAKMRELANTSGLELEKLLEGLAWLSPEELDAVKSELKTAQAEIRKLGSGQNYETFTFNEEQYADAVEAMQNAKELMKTALAEREKAMELRKEVMEERKKVLEQRKKAIELRKEASEK